MKDFKEFLLRGNLVDVAVGIVIGVAFAALVTAFVADLITPLLAAIGGKPNFESSASRSTAATSSTAPSSTR
jgi:large conductance mechanosensitive channel